jgi:hypothetical protein
MAIMAHVARAVLDADRPLARNELFPADPMVYGCKLITSSWKDNIIRALIRSGEIEEVRRKGEVLYTARSRRSLEELAVPKEEARHAGVDEVMFKFSKMQQLEKRARVEVALRALRRLLVAKGPQTRPALFILKRGDKYVEKAALDPRWQVDLLERMADDDLVAIDEEDTHSLYAVVDRAAVQKLVEGGENPCIHTLLWPDEPCTVPHGSVLDLPPVSVQNIEDAGSQPDVDSNPGPAPAVEFSPVDPSLLRAPKAAARAAENFAEDMIQHVIDEAFSPRPEEPDNQIVAIPEEDLDDGTMPQPQPEPTSAADVYELKDQEAEQIRAVEAALRRLLQEAEGFDITNEEEISAWSLSRHDLFPDDPDGVRWQRDAIKKLCNAQVVAKIGERSETRYAARAELRTLFGSHEWLMRLLMPAALNRYAVTQALRETGAHVAQEAAPQSPVSSVVSEDAAVSSELKEMLKEVGRLLPEFFEVLKYQHDRIESMEKEMKQMRAVNAKLDAVIAALGVKVDDVSAG